MLNKETRLFQACRKFHSLSAEHTFWTTTLENTSVVNSLACFPGEEWSACSLVDLRKIGLHTLRRELNWGLPQPRIYGAIGSLNCNGMVTFICQILGTQYIIVRSAVRGTIECWSADKSSIAAQVDIVGHVFSVSPAHYQRDGVTVGLLVGDSDSRWVLFCYRGL